MIEKIFSALITSLKDSLPEFESCLNGPAPYEKIQVAEKIIGKPFPEDLIRLYQTYDGELSSMGLFFGLDFLSLEESLKEWKTIREMALDTSVLDASIVSIPAECIRENYSNNYYFPIGKDFGGNYIGVDLDPGIKGTPGQLINFGRDEETRYVIAFNITDFLLFILFNVKNENYFVDRITGTKKLLLKKPANAHFLDALKGLVLPFGMNIEQPPSISSEKEFEIWLEMLEYSWKKIFRRNGLSEGGFNLLASVKRLNLLNADVTGLSPVEKFTGLQELILSGNPVRKIDSLLHLKGLKKLFLGKTKVEDIGVLGNLSNLEELSLNHLNVADISSLSKLKKLKRLNMEGLAATNVEPLSGIKSLKIADLSNNYIESFKPLENLTDLTELNISRTNLSDLSFLTGLKKLKELTIFETNVLDYTSLKSLPSLTEVYCGADNFSTIKSIFSEKINLGKLKLYVVEISNAVPLQIIPNDK